MSATKRYAPELTRGFLTLAEAFGAKVFTRDDVKAACAEPEAPDPSGYRVNAMMKRMMDFQVLERTGRNQYRLSPEALSRIDDIRVNGVQRRFRPDCAAPRGVSPARTIDFLGIAAWAEEGVEIRPAEALTAFRAAGLLKPGATERAMSSRLAALAAIGVLDRVAVGVYVVSALGWRHLNALRAGMVIPTAWLNPDLRRNVAPVPVARQEDDEAAAVVEDKAPAKPPVDVALAVPGVRVMKHGGGADIIDPKKPRSTLLRVSRAEFSALCQSGRIVPLGGRQTMFEVAA